MTGTSVHAYRRALAGLRTTGILPYLGVADQPNKPLWQRTKPDAVWRFRILQKRQYEN
jgi:hypothetical protein